MIKKYKFTICTTLIILYLLLMPTSDVSDETVSFLALIPYIDKIIHCCMFGVLSLIFVLEKYMIEKSVNIIVVNIIILIIFAIITEIMQKLSGYRSFEVLDILADSIGIILGTTIGYKFAKLVWRRK